LLYRTESGNATYEAVGGDLEFLTVHPDGSMSDHHVVGVCAVCFGRSRDQCPRHRDESKDESVQPLRIMPPSTARPVADRTEAPAHAANQGC
jgi:hypothetical protein